MTALLNIHGKRLQIGEEKSGELYVFGESSISFWIRNIYYYRTRLPNQTLQGLVR